MGVCTGVGMCTCAHVAAKRGHSSIGSCEMGLETCAGSLRSLLDSGPRDCRASIRNCWAIFPVLLPNEKIKIYACACMSVCVCVTRTFLDFFFFSVLGVEPMAFYMLGKHLPTEPLPWPSYFRAGIPFILLCFILIF